MMCTHPLMKLCDEPQLRLQVGAVLLCSDVTQEVFMTHPRSQEYIPLIYPWLLVLHEHTGRPEGVEIFITMSRTTGILFLDIKTSPCRRLLCVNIIRNQSAEHWIFTCSY